MNESNRLIGRAGTGLRKILIWTSFPLLAMCIRVDISLAAPGDFDGNYKGKFTLNAGHGNSSCVDTNLEQVMSVSGGQVYLDRKSPYSGFPLLLSGTVGADGTISASGVTQSAGGLTGMVPQSIFTSLTGKIQNGEFTGVLNARLCTWEVRLKK
jgi:hypothetical protein